MFPNATPAGHRSWGPATVLRAFGRRFLMASEAISTPAQITLPTPKSDGAEPMTALQHREALRAQIVASKPHSQRRAELVLRLRSLNNSILGSRQ